MDECDACSPRERAISNGADGFKQYAETLESLFPRSVPETVFIDNMTTVLNRHGYNPKTAINLVSTCRDELCRPFVHHLDKLWGHSFNISSLAGMVFCGRTGFKAAMAHAPVVDGTERYIFWVAPHIALPIHGETGTVYRPGREKPSTACGALLAVLGEMKSDKINMHLDPSDLEQALLKQHVVSHLHYGHTPTLTELTYAAHACIVDEVLRTAAVSVDRSKSEFIIVSGVQIHGALGQNFFWPGSMTKYAGDVQTDLYEEYAAEVVGWRLDGWVQGEALAELQDRERACRLAVEEGDVNKLLRAEVPLGQVLDHHRRSLLHIAALHGQVEVVQCLVGRASVWPELLEMEDCFHKRALDYAVEGGHHSVAEVLVAMGCGLDGGFLVNSMVEAVEQCDIEGVKRLFRFARDPQEAVGAKDVDGRGLIHVAAGLEHPLKDAMIDLLFSHGTQVTADFYGQVPRGSTELKRRSMDHGPLSRPASGTTTPTHPHALTHLELPVRSSRPQPLMEERTPRLLQTWDYGGGLADDDGPSRRGKGRDRDRGGEGAAAHNPQRSSPPSTVVSRDPSDEEESRSGVVRRRGGGGGGLQSGVVMNIVRSILAALLALMGLKGRLRIGATELLLGAAAIAAVIQRQRR